MKSQKLFVPLLFATLFCCWNGSIVDSEGKGKRPDVNFYGTIEDHHKTSRVEDILIGGKYEVIPVYQAIKVQKKLSADDAKQSEIDPKQNKILLDLKEIRSIELKHQDHPTSSQIEVNNRDYVEIIVTSITGKTKNYLIESSRKVSCVEIDQGRDKTVREERELNMIHIRKMIIKGYKSVKEEPEKTYHDKHFDEQDRLTKQTSNEKKEVAKNTENILGAIEKNVANLSHESPSTIETMKETILSLLKSLREQLQKMLNMLQ